MTATTRSIRFKGYTFAISEPYTEGHSLTAGEAKALNDLRTENIGNNFRSKVNDQIAQLEPGGLLLQHVLDHLAVELAEYDSTYKFSEKGTRTKLGDIEREIIAVARERAAAQAGEVALEDLAELVESFKSLPAVREEARSRVAARRSALSGGMESL